MKDEKIILALTAVCFGCIGMVQPVYTGTYNIGNAAFMAVAIVCIVSLVRKKRQQSL